MYFQDIFLSDFGDNDIEPSALPVNQQEESNDPYLRLLQVVCNENLIMVRYLVEILRQDPFNENEQGYKAVHLAAMYGQLESLKYFLDGRGINPACTARNKETLLHVAAYYGHLDIVDYLIQDQKFDPLCYDSQQRTPYHSACHGGNLNILKYLVSNCPYYSKNILASELARQGNTLLHFASLSGNLDLVEYLINEFRIKPDIASNRNATPLHMAAQKGHIKTVRYLINEQGCNPHSALKSSKHTPLTLSTANGHVEVTKFLIQDKKCDPNLSIEKGLTPLHFACYFGHIDTVKLIIGHCANKEPTDSQKKTPLHAAADGGHLDVCVYLVNDCKNNVSSKTKTGWTPLHYAAAKGHCEVGKFLLQVKPSLSISMDANKSTPIHIAALFGNHEMICVLLSKINKSKFSKTLRLSILKAAVKGRCLRVLDKLLDKISDHELETQLLLYAISEGALYVLKHLITQRNFDASVTDSKENTLLHIAADKNHLEIIHLLKELNKCNPDQGNKDNFVPIHIAAKKWSFGCCQIPYTRI